MRHSLLTFAALTLFVPAISTAQVERRLERTFTAEAGSLVTVEASGAPISVSTGSGRSVRIVLRQLIGD